MTTPDQPVAVGRVLDTYLRRTLSAYRYFNQGEIWLPLPPAAPIQIKAMTPEWRWNSAQMLMRNAAAHAERYGWGEIQTSSMLLSEDNAADLEADMVQSDAERTRNPERWMATTALYRGLIVGLPPEPADLAKVAELARHWSTCPVRAGSGDCSCEAGIAALPSTVWSVAAMVRAIREEAEREAAAQREAQRLEDERRARQLETIDDPDLDPGTGRPWGVDEDGFDHHEAHFANDHCPFDSCAACGGYHCGWYCADLDGGEDE